MEGQSKVHTWELLLRVEICAARDDPPPILGSVDVPHVVAGVQDGLRVDLLHEGHLRSGACHSKYSRTSSISLSVAFNMIGPRDSLAAARLHRVYESLNNRPCAELPKPGAAPQDCATGTFPPLMLVHLRSVVPSIACEIADTDRTLKHRDSASQFSPVRPKRERSHLNGK